MADPNDLSPALGGQARDESEAPRLGGDAALAHIFMAIQDADPAVRQRAIEALDGISVPQAITMLRQAMLNDADYAVRRRAALALADSKDERAHRIMRERNNDEDETIWQRAITSLGKWHDPADIEALLDVLTRSTQRREGWLAAQTLAEIGDPRVIPAIIEAAVANNWSAFNQHQREYGQA